MRAAMLDSKIMPEVGNASAPWADLVAVAREVPVSGRWVAMGFAVLCIGAGVWYAHGSGMVADWRARGAVSLLTLRLWFPALLLFATQWSVREAARGFGPHPELRATRGKVGAGDAVFVSWTLPRTALGGKGPIDLRLSLVVNEAWTQTAGDSSSDVNRDRLEVPFTVVAAGPDGRSALARLDISKQLVDLAPEEASGSLSWKLIARAKVPGWFDIDEDFLPPFHR